jgi:transcriptional regulator with XRE-family HTH domain
MPEGFKQTGELIKKVRKQKKITQAKLAELAEVSQGFIADLENGNLVNPNRQKLYHIAKILEIEFNVIWDSISYDEFVLFDQGTRNMRVNEAIEEYKAESIELSQQEAEVIFRLRKLAPVAKQAVLNLIANLEDMEKAKNEQASNGEVS